MDAFATHIIEGKLGDYTLMFMSDQDASNPFEDFDQASTLVVYGGRDYIDAAYGELADEVMTAIRRGYSEAAIARWLRLRGATGVHVLHRNGYDGELTVSADLSTSHGWRCGSDWLSQDMDCMSPQATGIAFLAPGVAQREYLGYPDRSVELVKSEAETYAAWASGDVFGYEVMDEDGELLPESCWGYYGLDRERDYVIAMAKAEVEAYEAEKIEVAEAEAYDEQAELDAEEAEAHRIATDPYEIVERKAKAAYCEVMGKAGILGILLNRENVPTEAVVNLSEEQILEYFEFIMKAVDDIETAILWRAAQ